MPDDGAGRRARGHRHGRALISPAHGERHPVRVRVRVRGRVGTNPNPNTNPDTNPNPNTNTNRNPSPNPNPNPNQVTGTPVGVRGAYGAGAVYGVGPNVVG